VEPQVITTTMENRQRDYI